MRLAVTCPSLPKRRRTTCKITVLGSTLAVGHYDSNRERSTHASTSAERPDRGGAARDPCCRVAIPWGAAATVVAAGVSSYDANKAQNAQKSAIAPLQAANSTAYSKATDIANTPYSAYTGTQVAPITGSQQQAIGQAQTAANDGQAKGYIGKSADLAGQIAGNSWNSATAQRYINPYQQNVTDIAQRQLNKQYANTINNQNLSAASSGAFGGDRAALTGAATTQGYLRSSADTAAKGQADAYDNAVKTWQADNGRAAYRAAIKLAVTRQSRWQGITRHPDHAADDCRWQALRLGLIVAGCQ
jgi:hypothetical protein